MSFPRAISIIQFKTSSWTIQLQSLLIMDYLQSPNNHLIGQGDICVIYVSESQRYILKIEPEGQLQTKFGQVRADALLGHPYGVRYDCKKGWVMPLRLTPELWTQLLPHRTQILYQADISMILLQLDMKPGSIVVESGTGSGSLSHSLIRACRPNGFLHTFEVNELRAKEAQCEFDEHKLGNNVRVTLRNVCEQGFSEELAGKADACMLDLPRTWDAIEHAYKVLKPFGSRLCTFSPCIEQVKQNVEKMTELKMKDIITMETLLRPYDVKKQSLRVWSDEILDGLVAIEKKRFENLKCSSESTQDESIIDDLNPEVRGEGDNKPDEFLVIRRALNDTKAPFHPNMLPKQPYDHPKQFNESVSHSGYLTFATKR